MTTENSRADALTDEQLWDLAYAGWRLIEHEGGGVESCAKELRGVIAAWPVEQPAAAPIDECELCHSSGYMDETLGGALPGVPDAPCMNGCKATEQTAPSPADERSAFESLKGAWQSMPPFDVFCAGWRAARAASANETVAEGGGSND